jgi:hypothetical protein
MGKRAYGRLPCQHHSCIETMRVRLLKKLAEIIDGVDLSRRAVGDEFRVKAHDAYLLIAEGWAEPVEKPTRGRPAILIPASDASY